MPGPTRSVRVWDLPVRLTHWSFVVLIPAMWLTAENDEWGWHIRFGHMLLMLLVFRVVWGFIGTDTARFSSFVKGPGKVIAYLRGSYDYRSNKGHSPLAALSVLALLGLMFAQVGMGLFAGDPFDGATGPLNPLVGVMTADLLTETHEWFYWVVFGFIALHITAVGVIGAMQATNLIGPMIVGKSEKAPEVADNPRAPWARVLIALAVALAVTGWVWSGAPPLS